MTQLDGTGMKRFHREWRRRTKGRLALVLDGVGNPFNVGAIVRTAASMSATVRYLTWTEFDSGVTAVEAARADGYQVIAIELTSDALPLHEIPMETDVALVIGHEDRGCTPGTLAACDGVAFIPQLGKVGSLNVAHAASIAIYEARRRSWSR